MVLRRVTGALPSGRADERWGGRLLMMTGKMTLGLLAYDGSPNREHPEHIRYRNCYRTRQHSAARGGIENVSRPGKASHSEAIRDRIIRGGTAVNEQMIRDDAGVVKNEKLRADRRPAMHQYREHQRQHQDVQDRFEQCPAVAQGRVAEPGAGLADDQGIYDPALGPERRPNTRLYAKPRTRPARTFAENDVIPVEGLKPAVQHL
jgi:hypothetical protein